MPASSSFLRAALLAVTLTAAAGAVSAQPVRQPVDSILLEDPPATPGYQYFFNKGRGYGSDAYAGPLDNIFNKGFAVAQWEGKDRHIFSYRYGWHAVWATITNPGPPIKQAGGWGAVLKRHLVPFGGDAIRQGQWVPNYFGHMLEGGIAYRRLLEWNRMHGVPYPTLSALLVTQFAVTVNEAYETPVNDPWVQKHGTAGLWVDWMINDPFGMWLFHHDGVSRFFANTLGAVVWPRQASITFFPGGEPQLINNGESVVIRPKLWFTDSFRIFFRGGVGAEMGVSIPHGEDGLAISVGGGVQSVTRALDPTNGVEEATFAMSGGLWVDRDGSLLFQATYDYKTDRALAIDVFPGVIDIGGSTVGAWFQLARDGTPYFGLTGRRTLGAGVGFGL